MKGQHYKRRDDHGVWHEVMKTLDGTTVIKCTGALPVYMPKGLPRETPTTCLRCIGLC